VREKRREGEKRVQREEKRAGEVSAERHEAKRTDEMDPPLHVY